MKDKNEEPPHTKTIPPALKFLIGGTSGMLSICIVQPMDLIKTRMQLMGPADKTASTIAVAKDVIRKEGVRGLYSGISAALFRQATYTTGRLGIFSVLFDNYKVTYGVVPNYPTKLGMGMIAGGVGAFIGNPAEVSLIRMTSDGRLPPEKRKNYKHVFNALTRIVREEGMMTLWRGTVATITRAMLVNGAQLGTYTQVRENLITLLDEGMVLHFCSAMVSSFVTSVVSVPADVIKTRVQHAAKDTGQLTVLMNVIKNEGFLTLWSGLLPTYAKLGPYAVFTFMFLEQLNSLYFKLT